MDKKLRAFAISLLRRGTFLWKPRSDAKKKSRVEVGEFSTGKTKYKIRCAICGELFLDKDIAMDHFEPVIPVDGFKSGLEYDLNEIVERMFCDEKGWNCLCKECHDEKSKKENETRRGNKRDIEEHIPSCKGIKNKPKKAKTI